VSLRDLDVKMAKRKMKLGIVGCGTIGREIALACRKKLSDKLELVAICDADARKASDLKESMGGSLRVLGLDGLIKAVDIVVEAASAKISALVVEKCVNGNKDVLIMSVGGLLGKETLLKKAALKGVKVYIPSGAICGLDGLKSASAGKIDSVTLTTRKPPRGLAGAPYLIKRGIDVSKIKEETVVFQGSAEEAVKGFPQNVNVAAVLSLAGIGARKTRVRLVTSPAYTKNVHEIEIIGECGRIVTRTENVPSKTNPKTSALAFLSAIATLEGATTSVRIGT
jgi:aspartate dehydrogenase